MADAFDKVMADPELARARKVLSIHEFRKILGHSADQKQELLLTVARVLRAKIKNEIYAEQAEDLWALNEALAPFDPLPGPATNEASASTQGTPK